MKKNLFTLIPNVNEILEDKKIKEMLSIVPRKIVLDSIREEIDILRDTIKGGRLNEDDILEKLSYLNKNIHRRVAERERLSLRRVINATGVVIHTNLGRSLLNKEIMENIEEIVVNYSNLEYDLESGTRGSRYSHLEDILVEITGAEAAMVVNNNAAAVLLALSALAKDREVIVSRGELIEIGGSFRIPEVMEQSGARLVEVGTTNKTHLRDYENAINEETGVLLKVHTSNYRILGFTSSIEIDELAKLKKEYSIPIVEDLGSGVLVDLSKYGLEYEPTVQESIKKGIDVVTFSGDKLLGGPQAGIIVGKKKYIDAMKKHPLTRAFRIDKFTISALEVILRYYLDERFAINKIPTLKMLTMSIEEINSMAKELSYEIDSLGFGSKIKVHLEESYSEVGGGSLPLEQLPTICVVLNLDGISTQAFENQLRRYSVPIITRLYKDKIYMDMRTLKREEFTIILEGIKFAVENLEECSI